MGESPFSINDDDAEMIAEHEEWMRHRYAAPSITARIRLLRWLNAQLPRGLGDVWTEEIKQALTNPDWSPATLYVYRAHVDGFYAWAYEQGWMSADPTAVLRHPRAPVCKPKPVKAEEVAHALANSGEPWRTCVYLGIGAGLRIAEMTAIRRQDITDEYVHVRNGKGGKERFVETAPALWEYVRDRPGGLLVRWATGRACTAHGLSSHQRFHWRAIGLPHWTMHRLRHTFATTMWAQVGNGVDPLAIRDLMGHSSIVTTQGYAQAPAQARRVAVGAVDALLMVTPAES